MMTKTERKRLVQTGKELCILTEEDIAFIMDPANDEHAVTRRMTTARHRSGPYPVTLASGRKKHRTAGRAAMA